MTRTCTTCGKSKSFDCFNREAKGKHGLKAIYRRCAAAAFRVWKRGARRE